MPELSALQQFQMVVLKDNELQQELRRCSDRSAFIALVIERAGEHGCAIAQTEVEAAMNATLGTWITRGTHR